MKADITDRLKAVPLAEPWAPLMREAAEEIERDRQEAEDAQGAVKVYCDDYNRVRAALEPFAERAALFRGFTDDEPAYGRITVGDFRRAAEALK